MTAQREPLLRLRGVRWVRQEDANGCALAVIAMVAGRSYEEVKTEVNSWSDDPHDWELHGTSHYTIDRCLIPRGFYLQRVYEGWDLDPWPPEPWAPIHIASVKQSSNNSHFVVMRTDGVVLDPMREGEFRLSDWPAVNNVVGLVQP